jgi:hypothetical protein
MFNNIYKVLLSWILAIENNVKNYPIPTIIVSFVISLGIAFYSI